MTASTTPTALPEVASSNPDPRVSVVGFSVVVVANAHNPSILNADFLRHNGIVGEDWRPSMEDCLTSPMLSQVAFDGGLHIQADPVRVKFEQSGNALVVDSLICASVAKGYLKTVPHVPYIATGVNVKCVLRNLTSHRVSNVFKSSADWTTFRSIVPSFELKAIYEMPGRRVSMDVQEQSDGAERLTVCSANVHRPFDEENQQMRLNSMLSALDSWKEDLADVCALAKQYAPPRAA